MPASEAPAIAYLASHYPLLSQQFVRREVEALRSAGLRVRTIAVRPTPAEQIRADSDRRAQSTTDVLLDGRWGALLAEVLTVFARRPGPFISTLRLALRSGDKGLRAKVWQVFYFAEAVRLVARLRGSGIRHLHVHFANNAADVARLAAHLATAAHPASPCTWSLSMHGPTEFMDVAGFDLAAKVRSAAFVACISDYARSQLMALVEPEHWPKLHVVHMGVEISAFPGGGARRRERPAGPLRVLFVGRLVPEKGVPILLEAAQLLQARGCAVHVTVVGDSPLRSSYEEQASARGLSDILTFVGAIGQDELPGLYADADVFCLPSFAEGIPVVLMEAMATELPVVTTTIAGIPELVRDGVTGLLVPAGRPDRVADALAALAADPQRRWTIGESARRTVIEEFDAAACAVALLPLFAAEAGA